METSHLDEHIEKLRNGGTLTENEVKALCDKVSISALACVLTLGLLCTS